MGTGAALVAGPHNQGASYFYEKEFLLKIVCGSYHQLPETRYAVKLFLNERGLSDFKHSRGGA